MEAGSLLKSYFSNLKVAGTNSKGLSQVCNNINKTHNCLHFLSFVLISGAQPPFYLLEKILLESLPGKTSLIWVFFRAFNSIISRQDERRCKVDMGDILFNFLHTMAEPVHDVTHLVLCIGMGQILGAETVHTESSFWDVLLFRWWGPLQVPVLDNLSLQN